MYTNVNFYSVAFEKRKREGGGLRTIRKSLAKKSAREKVFA